MLLLLFSYKVTFRISNLKAFFHRELIFVFFHKNKVYKIFLARKKPFQSNQSSGIINNFSVTGKDGEHKNSTANETETEKERELRVS